MIINSDRQYQLLERIRKILILNGSFYSNPGIINGKLGIAVYFYYLSNALSKNKNIDIADTFLSEITSLSNNPQLSFTDGLTGIGYGISYLNKTGYIKLDTNTFLTNADPIVFNMVINSIPSNLDWMISAAEYLLARIKDNKISSEKYLVCCELLILLTEKIELFYYTELKKYSKFGLEYLVCISRICEVLFQLDKYKINKNRANSILSLIKSDFSLLANQQITLSGLYALGLFIFVMQSFNHPIKVGQIVVNDIKISCTDNYLYNLRLLSIYIILNSRSKKVFDSFLDENQLLTISDLTEHSLNVVLKHNNYIAIGLQGISGLGLLILDTVNVPISKELIQKIAIY